MQGICLVDKSKHFFFSLMYLTCLNALAVLL